jgi:hypothetical protein
MFQIEKNDELEILSEVQNDEILKRKDEILEIRHFFRQILQQTRSDLQKLRLQNFQII